MTRRTDRLGNETAPCGLHCAGVLAGSRAAATRAALARLGCLRRREGPMKPMGNVVKYGDDPTCKEPMQEAEPGVLRCPKCGHTIDMREPSR